VNASQSARLLGLAAASFAAGVALLVALRPPADPPLRAGAPAPGFELPGLSGDAVDLGDLRGRVVFVNFWATWCPPCRKEAPALERLYRNLRAEGFEVLGVSIDDPSARDAIERFREEFGLTFPLLVDPDRSAYRAYQATGVPETFLVDRAGRVVERFVGPRDWDEPRYANAVRALLAGSDARCDGAPC
jgi:peroxiredoxin